MSKQDQKELRQQIACEWLEENYLQFGSLRHDVVTDRLQIRMADSLSAPPQSMARWIKTIHGRSARLDRLACAASEGAR